VDANTTEAQKIIQAALAILKGGDKEIARRLAQEANELAPELEEPWLLLAGLSEPAESLVYIEKALRLNPDSPTAQQALEWVNEKLQKKPTEGGADVPGDEAVAGTTVMDPDTAEAAPEEPAPPREKDSGQATPDPAWELMQKTRRKKRPRAGRWAWVALGIVLVGLLAGGIVFRGQVSALLSKLFSKEGCRPNLVIGSQTFGLRTIQTDEDGNLKFSNNHPDQAAWVKGTDVNTVFALIQTPENLALVSSIKAGDSATVTWANCNATTYNLSLAIPGVLDIPALLDQTSTGITILLPEAGGTNGFVLHGELKEETINTFNTPDASALQAEISLLETTSSPDGTTITVGISIYNYGQVAGTLGGNDVTLTPETGSALTLLSSDPALPIQLEAGTTMTIYFTFLRPATSTASLRILSIEYSLDGY